ncbi:MAG: ATP-binding protein [Planctomycetia bacterium]|nr:ATP-binding protein [Planctomycetia bacterium]
MSSTATADPKVNGHANRLERTTFRTSRLGDFCSEKQLVAQTGHDPDEWPLVIAKELLDNALDACEEASVAPEIDVKVDDDGISVADNGPGIPVKTVKSILDYSARTSSREAYVSPTRGAQGNALSTVFAMGFALDGAAGRVDVTAQGQCHEITFGVDPIRQQPEIMHTTHEAENVKTGTVVKVWWPDSASRN